MVSSPIAPLVNYEREHVRRQTIAVPSESSDQCAAVLIVMQQQDRTRSAGRTIGIKQRAQLAHQRIGRWQGIGGCTGRTCGCTLAAAGTDVGIDGDVVAGGFDRAGRTEIKTAVAADDVRTRMRAKVFAKRDVAWLVEGTNQIARLDHRAQDCGWIAWISAQISVAQVGCRK